MLRSIKEIRRDHLRRLIEQAGGDSHFAQQTGMNRDYVWQLKMGRQYGGRDVGDKTARNLEEKLGLPPFTLDHAMPLSQVAEPSTEYAATPLNYSQKLDSPTYIRLAWLEAAKERKTAGLYYPAIPYLDVQRDWVNKNLPGDIRFIRIACAWDDGMAPEVNSGDVLFVDSSVHRFDNDGLYVMNWQQRLSIKRLQFFHSTQSLAITSPNPAYKSDAIMADKMAQLLIFGRVLGIAAFKPC